MLICCSLYCVQRHMSTERLIVNGTNRNWFNHTDMHNNTYIDITVMMKNSFRVVNNMWVCFSSIIVPRRAMTVSCDIASKQTNKQAYSDNKWHGQSKTRNGAEWGRRIAVTSHSFLKQQLNCCDRRRLTLVPIRRHLWLKPMCTHLSNQPIVPSVMSNDILLE